MKIINAAVLTLPAFIAGFLAAVGLAVATAPPEAESGAQAVRLVNKRFDALELSMRSLSERLDAASASPQVAVAVDDRAVAQLQAVVADVRDEVRVALNSLRGESEAGRSARRDAELRSDPQARTEVEQAMQRIDRVITQGHWEGEEDRGAVELAMQKMTGEEHAQVLHRFIIAMESGELDPDTFEPPF